MAGRIYRRSDWIQFLQKNQIDQKKDGLVDRTAWVWIDFEFVGLVWLKKISLPLNIHCREKFMKIATKEFIRSGRVVIATSDSAPRLTADGPVWFIKYHPVDHNNNDDEIEEFHSREDRDRAFVNLRILANRQTERRGEPK